MSKEPELSFFQQLAAFASLAGLGGVVHYLTTLKTGKKFKWPSFFIELICSAFVGVIIGLFFISTNMPIYMALAGAGAWYRDWETDRKSTRLNSSHITRARMPSSA